MQKVKTHAQAIPCKGFTTQQGLQMHTSGLTINSSRICTSGNQSLGLQIDPCAPHLGLTSPNLLTTKNAENPRPIVSKCIKDFQHHLFALILRLSWPTVSNLSWLADAYRRATALNSKDYRAWYGLGQTYELLHMPVYAMHYFKRATQLRPNDARMWSAPAALHRLYDHLLLTERRGIGGGGGE